MPIRPEHVFLYPIDWSQLSRHVRFVRAGGLANIVGALTGRRSFTWATAGGGTEAGSAGAMAEVDVCDGLPRTSWLEVPGRQWC